MLLSRKPDFSLKISRNNATIIRTYYDYFLFNKILHKAPEVTFTIISTKFKIQAKQQNAFLPFSLCNRERNLSEISENKLKTSFGNCTVELES